MRMENVRVAVVWAALAACGGGLALGAGNQPQQADVAVAASEGCAAAGSQEGGGVPPGLVQSGSSNGSGSTRSEACEEAQQSARNNDTRCDDDEELHVGTCECVEEEGRVPWSCEARWTCVPG